MRRLRESLRELRECGLRNWLYYSGGYVEGGAEDPNVPDIEIREWLFFGELLRFKRTVELT